MLTYLISYDWTHFNSRFDELALLLSPATVLFQNQYNCPVIFHYLVEGIFKIYQILGNIFSCISAKYYEETHVDHHANKLEIFYMN